MEEHQEILSDLPEKLALFRESKKPFLAAIKGVMLTNWLLDNPDNSAGQYDLIQGADFLQVEAALFLQWEHEEYFINGDRPRDKAYFLAAHYPIMILDNEARNFKERAGGHESFKGTFFQCPISPKMLDRLEAFLNGTHDFLKEDKS